VDIAESYDVKYRQSNYFRYQSWLYWPFVKALVDRVGMKPGDSLLDAGCGQGFFSWLFAECGMCVTGVDISVAGITAARRKYQCSDLAFEVGDVLNLPCKSAFDYVFVRSCSLYNSPDFETEHSITDQLLSYLRSGGTLIFDYYSKLNRRKKAEDWIYHSVESTRNHASRYTEARVYFTTRLDTLFLGRFALTIGMTSICSHLSRMTGVGGEIIALVRKPS
jgi:SAM-dependent methyltransferase